MKELTISADSHVIEPFDLWSTRLPKAYRSLAPKGIQGTSGWNKHPGANIPARRSKLMQFDGVSAEILYPSIALTHFIMEDAGLQEACFQVYNNWIVEYCQGDPKHLFGLAMISTYDIDHAIHEMERCRKMELRGAIIWQVPHYKLPFRSYHYNKLWEAAQALDVSINMHVLTGFGAHTTSGWKESGIEHYRGCVIGELTDAQNALFDFIFYGILDKHPGLKIVSVENEVGWIPFLQQQLDYYYHCFKDRNLVPFYNPPSEYFKQIYATFDHDEVGGYNFDWWGQDNCMWGNDFPHLNSTWPNSQRVIKETLGHLSTEIRSKLLCDNVCRLYRLDPSTF